MPLSFQNHLHRTYLSRHMHEGIGEQSRKLAVPVPDGLSKPLPSYEDPRPRL